MVGQAMGQSIYLVAGEASADNLGAALMRAMKATAPDVVFSGVGGEEMEVEGLKSLFPTSDIAVMGIGPVLKKLPVILKRINEICNDIEAKQPDAVVLIDSQELSRTIAYRLRKHKFSGKIALYVCPTVWAWRPGRAKRLAKTLDRVLALLPFEPEAMKRLGGAETVYVGHPLLSLVQPKTPDLTNMQRGATVLLLPGSRQAELDRMLPLFQGVSAEIAAQKPDARFVLPAAPHVAERLSGEVANWPVKVELLQGLSQRERLALFATGDVALATSGTVALELALSGCPTVVGYRVSNILWKLRFLINAPYVSLPNLILGAEVLPELLQDNATVSRLSEALLKLLDDEAERMKMLGQLVLLQDKMGLNDNRRPEEAAAEAVFDLIRN